MAGDRLAEARYHIERAARALQELDSETVGPGLFPEEAFAQVAKMARRMRRDWERHGYWIEAEY